MAQTYSIFYLLTLSWFYKVLYSEFHITPLKNSTENTCIKSQISVIDIIGVSLPLNKTF